MQAGPGVGGLGLSPSSASALLSLGFCIREVRRSDRNQVRTAVQTGRGPEGGFVRPGRSQLRPHSPAGPRPSARRTGSPLLLREAGEGLSPSRGSCSDIPGMASGVAGGNGRSWGSRTGFRASGGRRRGQWLRGPRRMESTKPVP